MKLRLAALGVVLAVAAGVGWVSVQRVEGQLAALEACEAAERGDWPAVLERTASEPASDDAGRAAAECRCLALLATGDGPACVALLDRLLASPETDGWVPRPELSVHLIQMRRDAGRGLEAAELARRAARVHPTHPGLFYLELSTRSGVEDEEQVLRELEARLPESGPASARMRVTLANRQLQRGDAAGALRVLGDVPPPGAGDAAGAWFETRGRAFASADDLAGVQRSYQSWADAGGRPAELLARYALTLSLTQLADPRVPPAELLRQGFAASAELEDRALREALAIRLVLTLVVAGRQDEAIAFYDAVRSELALEGLSREELVRSAVQQDWQEKPGPQRRGELVFRIAGAAPGDRLLLSPEPAAEPDAEFEPIPVEPAGRARASRELGPAPARWVYRDAAGHLRASGTTSPQAGRTTEIEVVLGEPVHTPPAALSRRPADGRRRVALLLLDCADWNLVQYLRARGDLPVLDALLRDGYRAVLESDPPLTAAALEALVYPLRRSGASFVGLVHQLGVELAGLSSIGDNPFDALGWLLPEDRDLFATLGAGERSAANLLFAHGGIRAGRHGEVTGPRGERRLVAVSTSARDLTSAERERWPELSELRERDAVHVRTIAAELDAAEQLVAPAVPATDLLALRIEPLDILTHAHFAEAVRDGQDDGAGLLFSVYRYIDARLAAIHDALDADDVLIVMSDHGIRTAMEHSRDAIFVATGAGIRTAMEHSRDAVFVASGPHVPAGRAAGRPALRGVPRVLAELLEVETDWPDTGVASWSRRLPALARSDASANPLAAR